MPRSSFERAEASFDGCGAGWGSRRGRGRGGRLLAPHVARLLVGAQSLHRRMADPAVVRPFGERDLGDQLRLHPVGVPPQPRVVDRRVEGRSIGLDLLQPPPQLAEVTGVPPRARADLAGPAKGAVFEVPNQQRADPRARSLGIREAADHELLPAHALGLLPVQVAAAAVRRAQTLGHDPFQTQRAGVLKERAAAAHDVVRIPEQAAGGAVVQQRAQLLFARFDRLLAQILPVQVQQIEHEVGQRRIGPPVLQRLKAGHAAGQHRGDLTVQQRAAGRQASARRRHVGELAGPVLSPPAPELHVASVLAQPDPVAVELLFVKPTVALGGGLDQRGELRLEVRYCGH